MDPDLTFYHGDFLFLTFVLSRRASRYEFVDMWFVQTELRCENYSSKKLVAKS